MQILTHQLAPWLEWLFSSPFISCKKDLCRNHFNRNSKPLKSHRMFDFSICIFVSLIDCGSLKGLIEVVCIWPYRLVKKGVKEYGTVHYKPSFCDTPISGVPLTTRQPAETCEYRVSRYHTHLSHIWRPISV